MINDRKIIEFNNGKVVLEVNSYQYNNRLYIGAYDIENKEPFGDITVNLPELYINDKSKGFIDELVNSDMFDLIPKMKELGIIIESYGVKKYNYGSYEYVKFDLEKLKEYDKDGVDNYLLMTNEIDHSIRT